MAAGVFVAVAAAGCSSASSSGGATSAPTPSTAVPVSPAASSTTLTPTSSTQAASTTSSPNSATGEVALAPGAAYTVSGSGCTPGAPVQVTLEAPTHDTTKLASQPSDGTGGFSITVNVPQLHAPTADLSAFCVSSNAKGYVQVDVPIRFTA